MKRIGSTLAAVALAVGLVGGAWPADGTAAEGAAIVGAEKCKMCHKGAKKGEQFEIWEKSAHAGAFAALASDAALAVAKEKGIENPQEAAECLACHTTAGFLAGVEAEASYDATAGVGCEACHGPGSLYKKMAVMKDREAAQAAGLIIPDETTCRKCHNEKSPTYKEFDFAKRWEMIAHAIPTEPAE
jgi:hypothetical protein